MLSRQRVNRREEQTLPAHRDWGIGVGTASRGRPWVCCLVMLTGQWTLKVLLWIKARKLPEHQEYPSPWRFPWHPAPGDKVSMANMGKVKAEALTLYLLPEYKWILMNPDLKNTTEQFSTCCILKCLAPPLAFPYPFAQSYFMGLLQHGSLTIIKMNFQIWQDPYSPL